MKCLVVNMPDGSRWAVPVNVIAANRAEQYKDEFGGDVGRSLTEDTLPLFEGDPYEVHDWASNNMDWSEVSRVARLFQSPGVADYEEGWMNGSYELLEVGESDFLDLPGEGA